ncbi:putative dehydrogenase [Pseudaminobacter salicylatoxidans]|uniref:Putative dehydrogenase n=1 Tax=Pseudaminobacter salicylatoxidans TaxID=93369 RepID=A0A316BNB7_PSESE|nr:Gfo/Idh/MocA family oxidoreductase [Pseudaminobacter salicylatoxidans]PWJ74446.1 putative dehydrogenase [Pseudaminobacter salicylatoxidans]
MARALGIGVIGCGNISKTYFLLAPLFRGMEMRACADMNMDAAKARAREFGLRAETVEGLLMARDIDIVVNLTVPMAHHDVSQAILDAGKHVYSEKPFVLSVADGLDLKRRADKQGLRIGSAPDTFLGGSHQLARYLVDAGKLGRITSGTCHVLSHGMEAWHPNPDFFFQPGGGPVLDLGPYYLADLVQLIGPVKRVAALTSIPARERTIGSRPRRGERIPVSTPTTVSALLEFAGGAVITFNASWDVWATGHAPMELYGEEGTLFMPDPNFFGGELRVTKRDKQARMLPKWNHPFSPDNEIHPHGPVANYRAAGLADMALAIREGRPHRCSLNLALHVVEVMTAMLESGQDKKFIEMKTSCERPAPLGPREARALMVRR